MIARSWHGRVRAAQSDEYYGYMSSTGLADYAASPGYRGIIVQQWTEGDVSHFLLTTFWESVEAIKRFAGDDYSNARYYPHDDEYLLEREPHVRHATVLLAEVPATSV